VSPGADVASGAASVSADGRYVAFASEASTLVPGDVNGASDVFVRDRLTGTTTRVSGGSGPSGSPSISGDGRIVAFASRAPDLVPGDVNGRGLDVYLHDRATGVTHRLTPGAGLYESFDPSVSAEGGHVALAAERVQPGEEDGDLVEAGPRRVYVAVRSSGAVGRVSVSSQERPAKGESGAPSISADGRFVAFESGASNLVRGDRNRKGDVFVRDRRRGTTMRASVTSREHGASDSSYEPAMAAGGGHVAFPSRARDLTWVPEAGRSGFPALSGDGRMVAFTSARTGRAEVYTDGPPR